MTLQTYVSGAPEGLAAAARGLRILGEALHDGSVALTSATRLSTDEFDGDTADAFTTTATALSPRVSELGGSVAGFGRAVLTYADRLAEVQQVMRRARRVARGRGLRVLSGVIHPPEVGADEQHDAYRRLRPLVAGGWAVLGRAEQELKDAARVADRPESLETQWRRDRLTGIPADAVPAARVPRQWPPAERDWPADHPPTPSTSGGTTSAGSPSEPAHRRVAGHAGSRVDASAPALLAPTPVAQVPTIELPAPLSDLDLPSLDALAGELPPGWTLQSHPDPGVLFSAAGPASADGGPPAVFEVRAEPLTGNIAVWQAQHVTGLAGDLPGFAIEDTATFDHDGEAVSWVQYSHTSNGVEVVHEQWATEVDGKAITLTGSVPAQDYDTDSDLFQTLARTLNLRPMGGGSGGGSGPAHRAGGRW